MAKETTKTTQKLKNLLIPNLNNYQLKTTNRFWQKKKLQNLTIFTSNGHVSCLEAGVILSVTKSALASLLPPWANLKSMFNVRKRQKSNKKHVMAIKNSYWKQKKVPACIMNSTFKVRKCIPSWFWKSESGLVLGIASISSCFQTSLD